MSRNLIVFICLLFSLTGFSQTIKTSVVVVGANSGAYAAAIQSAKSGVKTLLIDAKKFDAIVLSPVDRSLKAGIYADFIKRVDSLQKSPLKDNHTLSPEFTAQVFKSWTDTIKNLTVLPNASITKIKKSGKGWDITLVHKEIKADILLDATPGQTVAKMAGLVINKKTISTQAPVIYSDKKYRTSVAVTSGDKLYFKPVYLSSLVVPDIENLVLAAPAGESLNILSGQAAGAIAAYCSFFKTTTNKLNVRVIQTELLTYNSRIIKFDDIHESDSSMIAFQHIGVTGILKGKEENGKLLFMPQAPVSTEELKQPLRELYSRSQIWFLDNKTDKLTLNDALSLIKFVGSRGEELNKEAEKGWKTSLRMNGSFDLKRVISRRELAILFDAYLQPYSVAVDLDGNIKT
ncbi:FAD-dependent oxidoreductase [Pedobacter sp. P351]|uniref:FAD-dependent oxidoreductase n=1 Tax=Pedobacter superstes TaxID=3133441 RepID=UPI0030B4005A